MVLAFCFFAVTGCADKSNTPDGSVENTTDTSTENPSKDDDNISDERILIAFFSRADENYGVGTVEKGNTQILAEMIQEKADGVLFRIQRNTPYPTSYDDCTAEAQREKGTRPVLLEDMDISEYDVIFIGYPIWYGDVPMPVYTFIENKDWHGKKVIPFSTNEGSGLAGTIDTITAKCDGATILDALSMRGTMAQSNRTQARQQVESWLSKLNIA